MEKKTCTNCGNERLPSEMGVRNKAKNILHEWCRVCLRKYAKEYREKNKKIVQIRQKDWYETKGKEWKKNYEEENKDKINKRDRERYRTDQNFRLKKILRSRLARVLKGLKKSEQTLEYTGLDLDTLRLWIEYQFDENMNWDNQGTYWDIDHVTPCSSFDFTDEKQIYNCFNWQNLRPLEKNENNKKNDKILPKVIKEHKWLCDEFKELLDEVFIQE